jgi:hypothetical protein
LRASWLTRRKAAGLTRCTRTYREKVTALAAALQQSDSRSEAAEALRGLVDAIVLIPAGNELRIDLKGNPAATANSDGCGGTQPTLSAALAAGGVKRLPNGNPPLGHLRFFLVVLPFQRLPRLNELTGVGSGCAVLARLRDNRRDSAVVAIRRRPPSVRSRRTMGGTPWPAPLRAEQTAVFRAHVEGLGTPLRKNQCP